MEMINQGCTCPSIALNGGYTLQRDGKDWAFNNPDGTLIRWLSEDEQFFVAGALRAATAPVSEAGQAQPFDRFHTRKNPDGTTFTFSTHADDPDSFPLYKHPATPPAAMDEEPVAWRRKTKHSWEYRDRAPTASTPGKGWMPLVEPRAALAAPQGNSEQAAELPAPPEMESLADLAYAREGIPNDWDQDYLATWQKLQVAERNKTQWRVYALKLRNALALRQTQDEDAIREHLARVFEAMPADEQLRGSQIAGQIRAAKQAKKEGA